MSLDLNKKPKIVDYFPKQTPRKIQLDTFEWLEKQTAKYVILELPVGCHEKGTLILMYNGSLQKVEDIQVGDLVMGPDSTPRKVYTLHQGTDDMYKISPKKGDDFVVNANHVLSLKSTPSGKHYPSSETGQEIKNISINDYLKKSNHFKRSYLLYKTNAINFGITQNLPCPPYLLGLYLGGDIKTSSTESLKELNLWCKTSKEKFIPLIYKTASTRERLELLAGILDTDGTLQNNTFDITLKSEIFIDDIIFVARSLGFYAKKRIKKTGLYKGNIYYRTSICGDINEIPTKLIRKQAKQRKQKKRVTVTSFDIAYIGAGEYYGFEVSKDNLYVMGNFIVTHNSGKSDIGIAYSRWLTKNGKGKSFILTPQKILQAQYEKSFNNKTIASLYGKANYDCRTKNTDCSIGTTKGKKCSTCPYKTAFDYAKRSPNVVFNYSLALLLFKYAPSSFDKRSLLVFDECHTLESHLTEFSSIYINKKRTTDFSNFKYVFHNDIEKAYEWTKDTYLPALDTYVLELEEKAEPLKDAVNLTKEEALLLKKLNAAENHYLETSEFIFGYAKTYKDEFVLTKELNGFKFKMLFGKKNFKEILNKKAKKFLFMSSTILDKNEYCKDLGIPLDETAFLTLPSEFHVKNRPVYYVPQMKMNAKWQNPDNKKGRKDMLDCIKHLSDMHKTENGIIHTGNFKIAEWLVSELDGEIKHKILHHNPGHMFPRGVVIDQFMGSTKPSILISPSITEGLDLSDDLGRFVMICKIPYGNLMDAWIKKRLDLSGMWYKRQALKDIIQGCGRVVRSKDDWGTVYILDESWGYLFNTTRTMVPKWWKDSYKRL